jgi:Derlin-2/3
MMNIPLSSYVHTRALIVCLTYLSSRLAPPGTQTSFFGIFTMPILYFPYALIGLDLISAGPRVAASSVTGAVVGHLWWWGVHDSQALRPYAKAPAWLRNWIDGPSRPGASASGHGVTVIPPREREESGGHRWGSGQRLGRN